MLDNLVALTIATMILVAIPGPNAALVVANSLRFGLSSGVVTVLGTTFGVAIQLLLVGLGMAAVLEFAAERAGWGEPMPPGRGRGVALFEKARTVIAQIVDISINDAGWISVDRAVCVVDPGQIIHPDIVVAMMEGGMVFGISAALFGEVTLDQGQVEQSNFHDYRSLRMAETPEIEVHLLPQGGRPEGIGETAVPGMAPALANAVFAATGKRIRTLPLGQRIETS